MKAIVLAILLLTSVGATAQQRELRECLIQPPVSPHPIFWIPPDKWCRMLYAQQRELRDPRTGKSIGRATTDSAGSQTIYGPDGRVTGRTATDSAGTTTIYDPAGRPIGTTTGPGRKH